MEETTIDRRMWFALVATILASGMVFLDGTVINLALPDMAKDLNAGLAAKQWIVVAFLVTLSSVILVGGALGDLFGRRKIYMIGLAGFGVSSFVCTIAPGVATLVSARAAQGIFGALIVPGSLAIINSTFPKGSRARAIGIWTASTAAVNIAGPFVGGFIVDVSSWRMVFLINIPLVLAALVFAISGIEESKSATAVSKLDITGALLAVVSLGSLTSGLIEFGNSSSALSMVLIIAGLILLGVFVFWEDRHQNPIVKIELFKNRTFSASNIMTFLFYGALSGFFFMLAQQLIGQSGYTAIGAGAASIPVPVMMLLLSSRVGALSHKIGPRIFMTVGPFVCALGMSLLIGLDKDPNYWIDVLPGVLIFGFGLTLLVTPLTATVMAALADEHSGLASGVNNAVSRVSGSIVVAALGIFSTGFVYKGTILLCISLCVAAGVVSFFGIDKRLRT